MPGLADLSLAPLCICSQIAVGLRADSCRIASYVLWLTVCWDSGNLMANCLSLSSKLALAYSHSGWATFQENELKHARSLETYVSSTACYLSKVKDPAWIQGVTKASILCRKTQEVPLQI